LKKKLQAIPFACPRKVPSDVRPDLKIFIEPKEQSGIGTGAFAQGYVSANRCFRNGQTMVQVTHQQVPPIKHPLVLGAAASRFWVPASAILALTVPVIESSFGALLVAAIGAAPLLPISLLAAQRAAVALSPVAVAADPKHFAACAEAAKALT